MSRKDMPVYSGVIKYFPDALLAISKASALGQQQHNPDLPLFWDRSKSGDELDAMMRHLIDHAKGIELDDCGTPHIVKCGWRILAYIQKMQEDSDRELVLQEITERHQAEMEKPYVPFYKPYGMSDEEYESELKQAEQRLSQWEAENEELRQHALHQTEVISLLPISKVVFFELKNGKYLASNGVEITTEFILNHQHAIFHDNGYVIIEGHNGRAVGAVRLLTTKLK